MPEAIGEIAELWRYPVKSMRGESLGEVLLDAYGVAGDRRFAFQSSAAPAGKPLLSSRERTLMLRHAPQLEPVPAVSVEGGAPLALHSPLLKAELERVSAPDGELSLLHAPTAPFMDVRPVSLVSLATLRGLGEELRRPIDGQRFRSNLVLRLWDDRPFAEDALTSCTLQFGEGVEAATLFVLERIPRCRMVSLDPKTTEADPHLLRHLAQHHQGRLGIYARVRQPGRLQPGQPVFLASGQSGQPS